MPKKKPTKGKPKVHKDLKGFEIKINEFGELKSNMNIEELNKFLNKNVDDKKLRDRDDLKEELENEEEIDEEEEVDEDVSPDQMEDVDDDELNKSDSEEEDEEDD